MQNSISLPSLGQAPGTVVLGSLSRVESDVKLGSTSGLTQSPFGIHGFHNSASRPTRKASWAGPRIGGGHPPQIIHSASQFYHQPFNTSYRALAAQRNLRILEHLFTEADEDGSGTMDLAEFQKALVTDPQIQKAFSVLGVQPHLTELVFKSLDKDRKGELTIEEFITGLTDLCGSFDSETVEVSIEMLRAKGHKKRRCELMSLLQPTGPDVTRRVGHGAAGLSTLPQVQRAFVHSALAKALHPATAMKNTSRQDR
mmetsp:Transcript_15350/g.33729  ORF Transcript_15350/g.33729 Transcript_15350/m.33729 type:complete len:256 (+) Transcript_15350:82-849(+)